MRLYDLLILSLESAALLALLFLAGAAIGFVLWKIHKWVTTRRKK